MRSCLWLPLFILASLLLLFAPLWAQDPAPPAPAENLEELFHSELPPAQATLPPTTEAPAEAPAAKAPATPGRPALTTVTEPAAFPTLHPLVVHFPVVLLPVATLFFAVGMLFRSRSVQDAGVVLALLGLGGALLAAEVFHPDTVKSLPALVQDTLRRHEIFADLTVGGAAAASACGALRWISGPLRRAFNVLTLAALLATTVTVAAAGDYGATLAYIHGVGPQGHYLERHPAADHD